MTPDPDTLTPNRAAYNPRLFDDSAFLKRGEPMPPPHVTGSLLGRLGVNQADRAVQEAAVSKWLSTHTPSATLDRSLRRNGFGDPLDAH